MTDLDQSVKSGLKGVEEIEGPDGFGQSGDRRPEDVGALSQTFTLKKVPGEWVSRGGVWWFGPAKVRTALGFRGFG